MFADSVNARQHLVATRVPAELLTEEQRLLGPLPRSPFTAAFGTTRRANRTSLISYGGTQYSVPHAFADETVWVRIDSDELAIVAAFATGPTEIARHRCALPGCRVIDPFHYPSTTPGPLRRRPRARSEREREFLAIGDNAERWLPSASRSGTGQLAGKPEEIVALARLNGRSEVNRALGIAADHDRFGFGDIASILDAGGSGPLQRASQSDYKLASTAGWQDFGIGAGR